MWWRVAVSFWTRLVCGSYWLDIVQVCVSQRDLISMVQLWRDSFPEMYPPSKLIFPRLIAEFGCLAPYFLPAMPQELKLPGMNSNFHPAR
jgi:hypothetical protein